MSGMSRLNIIWKSGNIKPSLDSTEHSLYPASPTDAGLDSDN